MTLSVKWYLCGTEVMTHLCVLNHRVRLCTRVRSCWCPRLAIHIFVLTKKKNLCFWWKAPSIFCSVFLPEVDIEKNATLENLWHFLKCTLRTWSFLWNQYLVLAIVTYSENQVISLYDISVLIVLIVLYGADEHSKLVLVSCMSRDTGERNWIAV